MRIEATPPSTGVWKYRSIYPDRVAEHSGSFTWCKKYFTRSDIVKREFSSGWRAPTPYVAEDTVMRPLHASARFKHRFLSDFAYEDDATFVFGLSGHIDVPPYPAFSSTVQSALTYRALAQVKDQKVNLAVTLAEIGETVRMIAKSFTKLRKAYNLCKAKRWKEAYDTLGISTNYRKGVRDLASGWLEMIYGWLPLISDIHGAVDEINRRALTVGWTIVGRARYEVTSELSATKELYYGLIAHNVTTLWATRHNQNVSLWFRVDMPGLQRAAAIGVLNPLTLAWEVTPFSFLLDWVASIGDWLESLDATVGLQYMGGTHTYRALVLSTGMSAFPRCGDEDYVQESASYDYGQCKKLKMDRRVIDTTPTDRFYLKNPFSTSHAITASALLITSLKTR